MGNPREFKPDFKIDRQKGIGASEIASALGFSRWQSPCQLWALKTGELQPKEDTAITRLDHALEPILLEYACETLGLFAEDFKQQAFYQDGYVFAHLDYIDADNSVIIECKTSSQFLRKDWGEELEDEAPDSVIIQVQAQCALSGAKQAYVPVLFFKQGVREGLMSACSYMTDEQIKHAVDHLLATKMCQLQLFHIKYVESVGKQLIHMANGWYEQRVVKGEKPTPQSKADCAIIFKSFSSDDIIDRDDDSTVALVERFKEIKARKAALNKQLRELDKEDDENRVALEIVLGESSQLWVTRCGGKIERKMQNRKGYTVAPSSYTVISFKGDKNK